MVCQEKLIQEAVETSQWDPTTKLKFKKELMIWYRKLWIHVLTMDPTTTLKLKKKCELIKTTVMKFCNKQSYIEETVINSPTQSNQS